MQIDEIILITFRCFIAYIFITSGIFKLQHGLVNFTDSIKTYEIIPNSTASLVAPFIIFVEISVGLALAVGWALHLTALIGASILVVFTIAVTINVLRGKHHDCGCNATSSPISWALVFRNLVLIISLLGLAIFGHNINEVTTPGSEGEINDIFARLLIALIIIAAISAAGFVVNKARSILPE